MSYFLCNPVTKGLLGIRQGKTRRMHHDGGVRPFCHLVDKQVIIAGTDAIVRYKTIVFIKNLLQV